MSAQHDEEELRVGDPSGERQTEPKEVERHANSQAVDLGVSRDGTHETRLACRRTRYCKSTGNLQSRQETTCTSSIPIRWVSLACMAREELGLGHCNKASFSCSTCCWPSCVAAHLVSPVMYSAVSRAPSSRPAGTTFLSILKHRIRRISPCRQISDAVRLVHSRSRAISGLGRRHLLGRYRNGLAQK